MDKNFEDRLMSHIQETFKLVFDSGMHTLILLSTAFHLPLPTVLHEFQQYSNTLLDSAIEKAKNGALDS